MDTQESHHLRRYLNLVVEKDKVCTCEGSVDMSQVMRQY